ncbi:uncharacterized protein LOC143583110 [Bidens hawaiensis]|uniref:uncharacterized protein LOC143583110 n=1 Tax=Bidens hawaiensis TaxID=980011 RepID=UPI004049A33E
MKPGFQDDMLAWWVDSGDTSHVCKDLKWFEEFEPVEGLNASIKKYFGNTPKSSIETPSSSPYANENNNKRSREEVEVSEDEIVGGQNSRHNHARVQFELFKDQRHNLDNVLSQQCKQDEIVYRVRLTAVVDVFRFLLKQGLAFSGHDESISSNSRGNFLELIKWYCERNDEVNKAFNSKSHGNNQLTSPKIQKEIVNACAAEVRKIIVNEIKDKFFSILIDESRDCSIKEQMAVVLRYADDVGEVIERFVGVVHVTDTCASSLKSAIDNFFAKNNLTMSKVRGQGYDGASNMRGELNGLKQKILAENKCAFYIHCFAHQLQLVVVATSSEYASVSSFFDYLTKIVNIVGASCKRKDLIRQKQHDNFVKRIETGEVCTGKGKLGVAYMYRCLDPRDSFQTFDREKLLRLAELYSDDFSGFELGQLRIQLDWYISNMKSNEVFFGLLDIGELAKKMVQMKYHITYDLVYRLVELALVLPVATATVKISFSALKFIKTDLRNKMGDNFLTYALVCYVEKDIFENVENEAILQRFQAMGPRRC